MLEIAVGLLQSLYLHSQEILGLKCRWAQCQGSPAVTPLEKTSPVSLPGPTMGDLKAAPTQVYTSQTQPVRPQTPLKPLVSRSPQSQLVSQSKLASLPLFSERIGVRFMCLLLTHSAHLSGKLAGPGVFFAARFLQSEFVLCQGPLMLSTSSVSAPCGPGSPEVTPAMSMPCHVLVRRAVGFLF